MRTVAVEADNDAKAEAGIISRIGMSDPPAPCKLCSARVQLCMQRGSGSGRRQAAGGRVRVGRARAADCATLFGYCRERNLRFSTSGG